MDKTGLQQARIAYLEQSRVRSDTIDRIRDLNRDCQTNALHTEGKIQEIEV